MILKAITYISGLLLVFVERILNNAMYVQTIVQFVLHLFLSQNNVRLHESEAVARAESVINVHTKKQNWYYNILTQ